MKPYLYKSINATSTFALTEWVYESYSDSETYVLPDGCRDIIVKQSDSQPEEWFFSDLNEAPFLVETQADLKIEGIRLRPGVTIDLVQMTSWLSGSSAAMLFGTDQLNEFCIENDNLNEALGCLASGEISILRVAKELGVSVRTLQRLVKSSTDQTPCFWFSLARVRKAGRALKEYKNISEAAFYSGYADQAHMTREMRKWFGRTPSQISSDSEFLDVISEPGYG